MKEFKESFEDFGKAMERLGDTLAVITAEYINRITSAFGIPTNIILGLPVPDYLRKKDETFMDWSLRLNREGYLDNPDIRWHYQKETFKLLVSPFVELWKKIHEY